MRATRPISIKRLKGCSIHHESTYQLVEIIIDLKNNNAMAALVQDGTLSDPKKLQSAGKTNVIRPD
jgi:hypothetical protein